MSNHKAPTPVGYGQGTQKEFRSVGNTPLNMTMEMAEPAKTGHEVAVGTTQRENCPQPNVTDAAIGDSRIEITNNGPEMADAAIGNSMISAPNNQPEMAEVSIGMSIFSVPKNEAKDQSIHVH